MAIRVFCRVRIHAHRWMERDAGFGFDGMVRMNAHPTLAAVYGRESVGAGPDLR